MYDDMLREFLKFYGPLTKDEVTALILLARKKYYPKLTKSQRVLDSKIILGPVDEETMFKIVRTFIVRHENGKTLTSTGDEVPKRALSFNIISSPKLKSKVSRTFSKNVLSMAIDGEYDGVLRANDNLLHAIMTASGKRHFVFDVDVPGKDGLEIVREIIDLVSEPHVVVKTHGGYHLVFKRGKGLKAIPEIKEKYSRDIVSWKGMELLAIPGTIRGGVRTELVKI